jgi:hypothetical protein
LSVLEAGHSLLDQLGRLLVDGRTSYRGLSETGSDRRPKSRVGSLCNPNQIRGKRRVCSRKISRCRLDGAGIGIWSDQILGFSPELTDRLVGNGRFQASSPSLIHGRGQQSRNKKRLEHDSVIHGNAPTICF